LRHRARVSNAGPREAFFECVFAPARNEYRFQVRAWDAKEAEEHLRASLRDNGVREAGALLVRNRNGVEVLRSGFYGPIE
jgi:hypothetical protein